MLEAIAILLLQAGTPSAAPWAPQGPAPLSDEALAMERSGPVAAPLRAMRSASSASMPFDWADRFDSSVMSVRLTTQIVEAMMQPERADFGFYSGFLLTPGTTINVTATIDGRDFQLR